MHKECDFYRKMKNKLRIKVGLADSVVDSTAGEFLPDFEEAREVLMQEIIMHFDTPVSRLWERIAQKVGMEVGSFSVVMVEQDESKQLNYPQMLPAYVGLDDWVTVEDMKIFHDTEWIVVPFGSPLEEKLSELVSLKNSVTRVIVHVAGKDPQKLRVPRFMSNEELVE